jgi:hypothetical protein
LNYSPFCERTIFNKNRPFSYNLKVKEITKIFY